MISEKQTSLQFMKVIREIIRVCWGISIRCEIFIIKSLLILPDKVLHLEYLQTVLLKQYVRCKLSFDEVFVFVDFVLR